MSDAESDLEWVNKVSGEALTILQHGLMRGITNMLETRSAMGGDKMALESLWYAVLVLEFIARSAVRDAGLPTSVQLNLMRASKSIGTSIYDRTKLGDMLNDEGIKSMEEVIAEMGAKLNTNKVGEA